MLQRLHSKAQVFQRQRADTAMAEYFATFNSAALSAALPAEIDERCLYEGTRVSVTVTSHAKDFPDAQGIWVTPSGRLPSVLSIPGGP